MRLGKLEKYDKGEYLYYINNKQYQIENNGYYSKWQRDMWIITYVYVEIDSTGKAIQVRTYPEFTNISDTMKGCIMNIDKYELSRLEVLS
jgi:hypothetical protein